MTTVLSQNLAIVLCLILFSSYSLADQKTVADTVNTPDISPYEKFHRDDLVRWQSWNKATLQQARSSGKLILLSSGYFACHYCHVMKHESFENPAIAEFINQYFIPVLIDRELHPVLDAQLLRFMEVIGAPQGWPLNVLLTPDGYPLVGTVYRPANAFLTFLQQAQANWNRDQDYWERIAKTASDQIVAKATVPAFSIETAQQQKRILEAFEQQARLVSDREYGGFGHGAKYPMSPQLLALLKFHIAQPSAWLETHIHTTLQNMAAGGLHDQLGGGFFRYATERRWRKPHYEKMLYDNAQLALVYLEAAHHFKEPTYQQVANKTLEFLLQSMSSSMGGFVASLSAVDEQGKDGGYYLWTETELESILEPREFQLATRLWQVIEPDDTQGRRYYLPSSDASNKARLTQLATTTGLSESQLRSSVKTLTQKALTARDKRRMLRDDKRLAGWNGLTLLTFARAAHLSGESRHQQAAAQLYQLIAHNLWTGEQLQRTPAGGISELADYAYIAAGLLEYARLTGKTAHNRLCARVVEQAWRRFYIDGVWRHTEDLELLLPFTVYPVTLPDTELPSPTAILISVTLQLDGFIEPRYIAHAKAAQRMVDGDLVTSAFFYGTQITSW